MEEKWLKCLAALVGAVVGLYTRVPAAVRLLLLLMTLDYVSGVGAAIAGRSRKSEHGVLSSKIGFIGLAKKGMILCIVLLASILDTFMESAACTGAVTLFYIINESLSLLENAVLLGVPIPARLRQVLEIAKTQKGSDRPST